MPVSIGKLQRNTAQVAIDIDGETLNVVYRPSGLTPAAEDQMHEQVQAQRGGASLVTVLAPMLVSWDLLDEDGTSLPTDEATLRQLPTEFLSRVVEAITENMRPNPTSGERSAAG